MACIGCCAVVVALIALICQICLAYFAVLQFVDCPLHMVDGLRKCFLSNLLVLWLVLFVRYFLPCLILFLIPFVGSIVLLVTTICAL